MTRAWREQTNGGAHIARLEESGQSVARYCEAHGLKPKTLLWWRTELRSREREGRSGHRKTRTRGAPSGTPKATSPTVKLAKVIPRSAHSKQVTPEAPMGLRITVAGAEVFIEPGCERELFRMALTVLREGER